MHHILLFCSKNVALLLKLEFFRNELLLKMYYAVIIYVLFFSSVDFFVCYPSNCSDGEIEHFLKSDELNSLFTNFAKVSRQPIFLNRTENKNAMKFAFNSSDTRLLPSNRNLYLPQDPPYICDQPARAIFHVTILSLDTVDESAMVS